VPNNAVQIILNADNFVTARETTIGGSHKEFFLHQDAEFARHKDALVRQATAVGAAMRAAPVDLGYAKVSLRRSALAKSHRPFSAVFKNEETPIIGVADLGQILVRVTSASIARAAREMEKSNPETIERINKSTGRLEPAPNIQRSETGAIEKIELYDAADRFRFSAEDAVKAFVDPRRGGTYYVELFEVIPQRRDWDVMASDLVKLFASFDAGLRAMDSGLQADRLDQTDARSTFVAVRLLLPSGKPPETPFAIAPGVATPSPKSVSNQDKIEPPEAIDLDPKRHARLLAFLRGHPLVRSVAIAPVFVRSSAPPVVRGVAQSVTLPTPDPARTYPLVGIIDGGIGAPLAPWVEGEVGYIRRADRDEEHGTMIAGLVTAGNAFNGGAICPEPDGCKLVDIDIMPSDVGGSFSTYYPAGSKDFFEALEDAILACRKQYGVRVFVLSINADKEAALDAYSHEARKLDAIAEQTDVIIVVSAGNVDLAPRPEWSATAVQALSDLAVARGDTIQIPAETVRNVSVSALNPPDVPNAIADALACYSRRGPGLRSGLKPDISHYGGARVSNNVRTSGLYTVDQSGNVVECQGTSFAAPLIAKALASLAWRVEGEVSRETLLALLTHYSDVRAPLTGPAFVEIARHLVGVGRPISSDQMLECADYEITMVFAARLRPDKRLLFPFSWPRSLVDADGKCRGEGHMTLVFSPPLNYRYGAEMVRITLDAALQQESVDDDGKTHWKGAARQRYLQPRNAHAGEAELINDGLKWSTVKQYTFRSPKGIGRSSNWRVEVDYLLRNLTAMPDEGVAFTLILTIKDPEAESPNVFNDARLALQQRGTQISDIRTAARVTPRT
jgi:Subtilase family